MNISGKSGAESGPRLGPTRPTFGLAKDQGRRVEVTFVMRNGGMATVFEELAQPLTEELVKEYSEKLAREIAEGGPGTRTFADGWGATGQRAWVVLREVVAFSVRPAR